MEIPGFQPELIDKMLVCANCKITTNDSKFCPQCGDKMKYYDWWIKDKNKLR